jgi:TolA-binding protein
MLRLSVFALMLVVGARTAAAQAPRYPRLQPAPPPVSLSDRVKPIQPSATPAASPKPTVGLPQVRAVHTTIGVVRPEQERILADLIQNTPDSEVEEKSDYYFRLATFYSQQVHHYTAKVAELDASLAANPQARDAKKASEQQKAAQLAKMNLLKAVKVYKGLSDNEAFRNYPKMDLALFEYGLVLQAGKYMNETRAVFDKLLKNYPNSQYVPEAHLVFGDYYYEAGQLADAEARYKTVLKFPKSNAYWYAMYKVGWIHLQLQRHQEALEAFAQVVYATRSEKKWTFLKDAAKRDFVYAYAAIGKPDKALSAFTRLDKDGAVELVVALADDARAQGNFDVAASAYRQLVSSAPDASRACDWQYRLAHVTLSSARASNTEKIREIELLVEQHVQQRTAAGAAGQTEDFDCRDNAMAMAGELAVAYHNEWSKTFNIETLGYAERLYTAYVNAVPGAVVHRAALAEALWYRAVVEPNAKQRAAAWERAATAFMAVGTDDANRAAGLAWLNVYDYAASTDGKLAVGRAPGATPREQPLKGRDKKLVEALTTFLASPAAQAQPQVAGVALTDAERTKAANEDDEVAQMRLLLATTLRKYNHYDDATDVLDVFLAQHPTHASAELAANMLLHSLVQLKSPDLGSVVSAMTADTAFVKGKPQLLANLTKLRRL